MAHRKKDESQIPPETQSYLVRHEVEQKILPKIVFENPKQAVVALYQKEGELLYQIYNQFAPDQYRKDQFTVKAYPNRQKGISIMITLPPPEMPCLCQAIGISVGEEGRNPQYFMIELTMEGTYYLCRKSASGTHAILCGDEEQTLQGQIREMAKLLDIGIPDGK